MPKIRCERCKGKGEVTEEGWDFDASDPFVREGKRYGMQTFKCPMCEGMGKVEDAAAVLKYRASRGDPDAKRMIRMLTSKR